MLKRGQIFHIVPSDGFLGIAEGDVRIVRISGYEDVVEEYADPEVIVESDISAKYGNWIVYKYLNGTDRYMFYCLDEDTFKYHTNYVEE